MTDPRSRVTVALSRSLRLELEEARERSGRTLTDEIEARLRLSLDQTGGDDLLLLRLDSGLTAWLRAFVAGPGFFGNITQTAIYLIRSHLNDLLKHDVWYGATVPHLPSPIREANEQSPKYRALKRLADG